MVPLIVIGLLGLVIVAKGVMLSYPSVPMTIAWGVSGFVLLGYMLMRAIQGYSAMRDRSRIRAKSCVLAFGFCVAGIVLNSIVILANKGFMPASDHLLDHKTAIFYIPASGGALSFLGDVIGGFSIGDVMLGAGLVFLAVYIIISVRQEGSWSWLKL